MPSSFEQTHNPLEIKNCNQFLKCEIELLKPKTILLALGTIAHNAILSALTLTRKNFSFSHAARHELPNDLILYDSYHCSRYNTQTKRLTTEMFNHVFLLIKKEMGGVKMPYINVKLAGKLDKNQKQEIAKEITDVMQRVANKPASYTYIVFEEVESEDWAIGGNLLG